MDKREVNSFYFYLYFVCSEYKLTIGVKNMFFVKLFFTYIIFNNTYMKRIIFSFSLAIIFCFNIVLASQNNEEILFYGKGCGHCAKVIKYLEENNINIEQKEIYQNSDNAKEFNMICDKYGISMYERGVPMMISNDRYYSGAGRIIDYFKNIKGKNGADASSNNEAGISGKLTIPLLIGAAIVDAINPCAFAVLLILMTTILASGERRRALFSGIAFSISIFISYFLMGLGLYSVIASIEFSVIFTKIIGCVAILLGLLNLKDFFWYGKGVLMEVPISWRSNMKEFIRSVTGPIGAFLIGFVVSLFLLPCTSGPYIVIISMLGQKETYLTAVILLLVYNIIFVLPMIGITVGTYLGMNIKKAEEKRQRNLKILHLIAGIIMVIMGIVIFM